MSDTESDDSSVAEISALHEVHGHLLVDWKINQYFDLPNDQNHKFLDSPTFSLSEAKWYIRIYPNGLGTNNNGHTSIFLYKKHPPYQYKVFFTLGIKKSDGSVLLSFSTEHNFVENDSGFGWYQFYPRSELIELKDVLATDGVLTVFCAIYLKLDDVAEKSVQTSFSYGVETLSKNFKDLFDSGAEGDVTFKVKGAKFIAHQVVLGARSTVFQAMFKTDMLEKNSGIVDIEDSDPACFKGFLTYIYSGKLDAPSSANALGVYSLAEKYNFQELKVACCECMAQEMSADSVCDVVHLASMHNEQELLETATQFFVEHAKAVLATSKWISFMEEHTILANGLLLRMASTYIK